ncbi:hypothetical protein Pmar_PMAR009637 [Perkinsus marinus ATCC 50983]|uniref:Uncharacterized protein n=1 Tax=Perkinsus marinus (strain ATCC 50983 / TXsc) TaxID=423536 RepID=C5M020_PERM5|nr:hypothetical protein Pmar_PMAR009637 [Perkinsus marinus ATCC 50983]EEQ97678.1 hypothetical protein Pmar_PMAR009637 [Perkinsus marinus ATCC 50983]|eukprot:XP_002764961.1 hypothetical protein Pmar_PMAR009637 [Perkinsus marinus ATCC 50983]
MTMNMEPQPTEAGVGEAEAGAAGIASSTLRLPAAAAYRSGGAGISQIGHNSNYSTGRGSEDVDSLTYSQDGSSVRIKRDGTGTSSMRSGIGGGGGSNMNSLQQQAPPPPLVSSCPIPPAPAYYEEGMTLDSLIRAAWRTQYQAFQVKMHGVKEVAVVVGGMIETMIPMKICVVGTATGTPLGSVVRFVERKWAIQVQHYANDPGSSDADRAMYSMVCGQMLHTGYGCDKDEGKAYEYFSKAAALGHRDAKVVLEARQEMVNTPHTSCFD